MKTLEEIRAQLRDMRLTKKLKWQNKAFAEAFPNVHIMTLWRIMVDDNYIPRRDDLRDKLDLPRYVRVEVWPGYKIRHERLVKPNGGHGKSERQVCCPNCKQTFPERGNVVKSKKGPK